MDLLSNLRILVTRPRPQGDILCQHIRAAKGEAIYFPTIDIVPLHPTLQLEQFDWLFFMSPQAVYHSARAISLPEKIHIAAVGAGTAQALREANIPVHVYPESDWRSEGLLDLAEFQELTQQKIAIISGERGRDVLHQTLRARGASVTSIAVYRRVIPKVDPAPYVELLHAREINAIVCTSVDGVKNLIHLLAEAGQDLFYVPLLVISERIAHYAKDAGFEKIILARNAEHDVIIATLASLKG